MSLPCESRHHGTAGKLASSVLPWLLYILFLQAAAGNRGGQAGSGICSEDLHVPKVALLFLARGGMPLERLWEGWFRSVAGLVPTNYVREQLCDSGETASVHQLGCSVAGPQEPMLRQQLLFSVHVHSSRINFTDFPASSVFHGTLLGERGAAEWGDTTPAVKLLLGTALRDARNAVFALLSDSDVPLYPARLTYHQLSQETLSRVDACHAFDLVNLHRYTCAMAEDGIDLHDWRKSNLFMLLTRKHATLFRDDQRIYQSFRTKCSGVRVDDSIQAFRGCLTDEHYYASFLAANSLAHETDCIGAITLANFTESVGGHPKLYTAADVDGGLLARLRRTISWLKPGRCASDATYEFASAAFMPLPTPPSELDCGEAGMVAAAPPPPMDTVCHMFFRKFDASAVDGLLAVYGRGPPEHAVLPA